MALANVADILARAGLRVLMIDFDLEAPGLEQYFPIDQNAARAHLGLLDLILRYKLAMSNPSLNDGGVQDFRRLRELFITDVYPQHASGGKLDLITAGQRGDDDQLSRYALNLRQFDWQDFYFNWGGELFFEWLRRSLDNKMYDIVLVDSRTGVTEMGGICAYQLAEVIVVLCASNQQNLEGTYDIVRNFLSSRVRMLRGERDLRLIVVPARVEIRDDVPLEGFKSRFEGLFEEYASPALADAGIRFWDLLIPYEPQYAFQERVLAKPEPNELSSAIRPALQKLVEAIAILADKDDPIRQRIVRGAVQAPAAEPLYDLTSRSAGFDVFLSCQRPDRQIVSQIAKLLKFRDLSVFFDEDDLPGEFSILEERRKLEQSRACAIFVGPSGQYPWRQESFRAAIETRIEVSGLKLVPVLLPGASIPPVDELPPYLNGIQWCRIEKIQDAFDIDQLAHLLKAGGPTSRGATITAEVSPYKGLQPYNEADATFFFGREALVHKLLEKLRDRSPQVVVGASGIGKTSLVLAGLLPALRRGAIAGSESWKFVVFRPGPIDPRRSLIDAFLHVAGLGQEASMFSEADIPSHLLYLTRGEHYLFVIDQFEELFFASDPSTVDEFAILLTNLADKARSNVKIILIVRADYIGKLLALPTFASVEGNLTAVGPLSRMEMRTAIEEPARRAGFTLEPGLVELIMSDMGEAPGALSLLQYALNQMWEQRRAGYLTVEAYREIGGISGAIARDADRALSGLSKAEVDIAISILLRLVSVTPEGTVVRRLATLSELIGSVRQPEHKTRMILDQLVDARIIVGSSGTQAVHDTIYDLAHEALMREWPRLREGIAEEIQWLHERTRLNAAAQEWETSGRSADYLYKGLALAQATALASQHHHALSDYERTFLAASVAREKHSSKRRRNFLVAGVVFLMAVAALSTFQWREAAQQRDLAVATQKQAEFERKRAEQALRSNTIADLGASSVISPDGQRLLTVDQAGRVKLINLATGRDSATISKEKAQITSAAFSPDGRRIAIGTINGAISVLDSNSLQQVLALIGHVDAVRRIAFSPDGKSIASGSDDKTARLWSASTGAFIFTIHTANSSVVAVAFSPDGSRLIISSAEGDQYITDPATGMTVHEILR